MKIKHFWLLVLFCSLLTGFFLTGCEPPDDDDDDDDQVPYRDIPALAADPYAVVVDPYDGSLELIDAVTKKHISLDLTPDYQDAVVLDDGRFIAVLDSELDQISMIDVLTAKLVKTIPVGEAVNRLIGSPYGPHLLAIFDPNYGNVEYGDGGLINYFELNILDTATGTNLPVSMDFTPSIITFNPDGKTCLLGKDFRLIQLDLETVETISFPLSLGPDDPRTTRSIAISPDGEFAMAPVTELQEVYVLDLINHSINILDFPGIVTDVKFIPQSRIALLPIRDQASIAIVNLDEAIPEILEIGIEVSDVLISPDASKALFYRGQGDKIMVLDLMTFKTRIYPLEVDVSESVDDPIVFTPDSQMILVIGRHGSGDYGANDINLIDLVERVVIPFGLEGQLIDYEFGTAQNTIGFLLPLEEKFIRLSLESLQAEAYEIGEQSRRVEYLPTNEAFIVDYDLSKGRITFIGDEGNDLFWSEKRFFDF